MAYDIAMPSNYPGLLIFGPGTNFWGEQEVGATVQNFFSFFKNSVQWAFQQHMAPHT